MFIFAKLGTREIQIGLSKDLALCCSKFFLLSCLHVMAFSSWERSRYALIFWQYFPQHTILNQHFKQTNKKNQKGLILLWKNNLARYCVLFVFLLPLLFSLLSPHIWFYGILCHNAPNYSLNNIYAKDLIRI